MAGETFDSGLDALISGSVRPMPSDPMADLLAGSPAMPPVTGNSGAVDISALVGLSPVPSPLDALLQSAPLPPAGAAGGNPPAQTIGDDVSRSGGDPLADLLGMGGPTDVPMPPAAPPADVPADRAVPSVDVPSAEIPSAGEAVMEAFGALVPPTLDRDLARRVPAEIRRKMPHASCPDCGKPGVPSLPASNEASIAAIRAGLAWAAPESEGWRCLACGREFLSRHSPRVECGDADGFARLRGLSARIAEKIPPASS